MERLVLSRLVLLFRPLVPGAWPPWRRKFEATYKDGKLLTAVVWKRNGEKCPVTNLVNGNGVLVFYDNDDAEIRRETYREGDRVSE